MASWFIHLGTDQSGPFTIEQIRELLRRGEIQPHTHVSPSEEAQPEDKAVTVIELLKAQSDPTYGLFDLLRTARDKRAHPRGESEASSSPLPPQKPSVSLLIRVGGGFILIGFLIWAIVQKISPPPTETSPTAKASTAPSALPPVETKAPPPRPSAFSARTGPAARAPAANRVPPPAYTPPPPPSEESAPQTEPPLRDPDPEPQQDSPPPPEPERMDSVEDRSPDNVPPPSEPIVTE